MSEQRPIAYKSLGFTLGLGSKGLAPSGSAATTLLDTLLSSVPSAKALLPTLVPERFNTKPLKEPRSGNEREGLASAPSQQPGASASNTAEIAASVYTKQEVIEPQPRKPSEEPQAQADAQPSTVPVLEVIDLLSDSDDGEVTADAGPASTQADAPGLSTAAPEPKPVPSEYIPVPKTEATKAEAGTVKGPAPGSADALADEEEIRRLGSRPYWMSYVANIESPMLRLHQELVELCELVQPTPDEAAARKNAVAAVADVIRSIWPEARCEVFGSYATGLYVPTSDIDLVILDSGCANVQNGLKALATALSQRQIGRALQVIGKARVPIVKFETVDFGNLAFDVSFDVANGPQAAELVREMTCSWPMMRPLILCLKLFLQQRELNEVYTGGIGSYALITLVAAFLQLHASRRPNSGADGGDDAPGKRGRGGSRQVQAEPLYGTVSAAADSALSGAVEPGLGTLLVDFFRFYGRVVNMPVVGVSCAGGGQFYRKTDKETPSAPYGFDGWLNRDRTYLLSVEDPKDPDNDVTRNSFNIMRVKAAFEWAYHLLTAPAKRYESLLARILRLGPILASRPRPHVEHLRELGYYCEPPAGEELMRLERRQRMEERIERRREERPEPGELGVGNKGAKSRGDERSRKEADRTSGGGKKRGRDSELVADRGGDGDGTGSGKRARGGDERQQQRKRDSTPGKKGGKGDRVQKRRRDEASPAARGGGNGTPGRGSKRSREDVRKRRRQSEDEEEGLYSGERQRGGGGTRSSGRDRQAAQQQQQQQPHRRPALMQVTAVPAAPPPAPVFHPGFAPPPSHSKHRHHHRDQDRHRQSQHRQGGGGGGGSRGHHHNQHYDSQGYQQQQQHQYRDDRSGGGGGGGHSRQRAPLSVAPQPLRGKDHNHNGKRTHVFFD